MLPHGLRAWAVSNAPEARLVLRITVAGVAAFLLARAFALAQPYWAVITAVIIMQASVGGSLKAVIDRFIGTLAGAGFGAAVAVSIPHASDLMLAVALVVALVPLAWIAARNASFRLAPVTAVIVLLPVAGIEADAVHTAIERIIEICFGNVVGLAVALVVLPARAHALLTTAGGQAAELEAALSDRLLGALSGGSPPGDEAVRLDRQIGSALKTLESAVDEAKRERRSRLTDQPDPEPLLRTLTRLRNDLGMVAPAAAGPADTDVDAKLRPSLMAVRTALTAFLASLGAALKQRRPPPALGPLEVALAGYFEAVDAIRVEGATRGLSVEAVGRMFTLRLALAQMRQNLRDLHARATELALKATPLPPPDSGR
ncbi:MAG: FUSC family protein [Alphaproteobacteria bacterium]